MLGYNLYDFCVVFRDLEVEAGRTAEVPEGIYTSFMLWGDESITVEGELVVYGRLLLIWQN